jgi:hypothetical protein
MLEILRSLGLGRPKFPVDQELNRLRTASGRGFPILPDPLAERYLTYLEFARSCDLLREEITFSCMDLALTLEQIGAEKNPKTEAWESDRQAALVRARPPREIEMHLYPAYFAAILRGKKCFEGRAYDPNSPKNYSDIREGDRVVFRLTREIARWESQCRDLRLNPDVPMAAEVGRVVFAPLVHWMYQLPSVEGEDFQPMISGAPELLNLQRAAVYYTFPGYPQRIRDHGFIGIEVLHPKLQA